jgi:hypothetical protein
MLAVVAKQVQVAAIDGSVKQQQQQQQRLCYDIPITTSMRVGWILHRFASAVV